jgi:hypothetical protein
MGEHIGLDIEQVLAGSKLSQRISLARLICNLKLTRVARKS